MAFAFDSASRTTHRPPYRLYWGRVAAAGLNLALWSLIAAAVWAGALMVMS